MPLEATLTFFHRKSAPLSFKQFVVPSGDIYLNFTVFVALSVVLFKYNSSKQKFSFHS